jgi:7-cyano-7-deazaguanine synthase in queuosine biosynthesis
VHRRVRRVRGADQAHGSVAAEAVEVGVQVTVGAPLDRTWSCYQSSEEACGICDSCALRRRAFAQAGLEDPIRYAAAAEKSRKP